ncbi:hypothetical protein HKCCE3408_01795 [Rhodobacterales bacterium HKCCE3408]|nr:hypothetical protein [Rhodobacterales bacterium HKCCE3408]
MVLSVATAIAAYVAMRFGYAILQGGNYWTLGDWLINYEGGFTRRGLAGTITLWLSDATGLSLTNTAGLFMIAIYAAMAALYLYCFASQPVSYPLVMLMLSPVTLLMPFYYVKSAMVKETVAFLALTVFATAAIANRRWMIWIGGAVYVFSIFTHEATTFYAPFLCIFAWLFARQGLVSNREALWLAGGALAVSAVALGVSAIWPGHGLPPAICESVLSRGVMEAVCANDPNGLMGPITWLDQSAFYGVEFTIQEQIRSGIWWHYIIGYALAILPFFLLRPRDRKLNAGLVYLGVVLGILVFAPLFVVATDWGRWIGMYVFVMAMLTLVALDQGLIEPRNVGFAGPLLLLYPFVWSLIDFGDGLDWGLLPKATRAVERILSMSGLG